jgi:hypothetical protein
MANKKRPNRKGTYDVGSNQYQNKGKYKVKGLAKGQPTKSTKPKKPLNPSFEQGEPRAFMGFTPQRPGDYAPHLRQKWKDVDKTIDKLEAEKGFPISLDYVSLGGWIDEETGKPLIETSKIYSLGTTDKKAIEYVARTLANKYNQDSVIIITPNANGKDEWVEWDKQLSANQLVKLVDDGIVDGFTATKNKFCIVAYGKNKQRQKRRVNEVFNLKPNLELRVDTDFIKKDRSVDAIAIDKKLRKKNERYGIKYGTDPPDYDEWLKHGVIQNSKFKT